MNPKLREALKAIGARLKRRRKHLVYELPDGRNIVMASTPSDRHADANALRLIARMGGDDTRARGKQNLTRDSKKSERNRRRPGAPQPDWTVPFASMSDAPGAIVVKLGAALQACEHELDRVSAERWQAERQSAEYAQALARTAGELKRLKATRWYQLGVWLRLV